MAKLTAKTFTFGARKGQAMEGRHFTATLIGGPELAAALRDLERKAKGDACKAGVAAMGEPIADAWRERVPVLDTNYQRSIQVGKVRATKNGASGIVHPTPLADLEDNDQPWAYAATLEYGDASRAANPSARSAFDASSNEAVEAAAAAMRPIVMEAGR